MKNLKPFGVSFSIRMAFICGGLIVWELVTNVFEIPHYILPSPRAVLRTLEDDRFILWDHFKETLFEWSLGLSLSLLLALLLSWIAFENRRIGGALERLLVVSQSIPYLTIAPLLLLWLGLGAAPKVVLILLTCTFPIAQLTIAGLSRARLEFGILAEILRLRKRVSLMQIFVPAALPDFLEGMRIAVTYAFVSSVLAELIGSEAGLGVYLSRAQSAYRTDRVLAVVVIIVSFSLLCAWSVKKITRNVLFWKVSKNV